MAQLPILLGAVQTYKMTDIPSSTQEMGMANSQLLNVDLISALWNIFCLYSLQNIWIIFAQTLDAQYFQSANSCVMYINHKYRRQNVSVCCKNFNGCTHQNVITTRNRASIRNRLLLPPWCLGIAVFFLRLPKQSFANSCGRIWKAKKYI